MTDRPIIFSGPMIAALLARRKNMTRRLATSPLAKCQVGDRLYVRESLRAKNMDFLGTLGLSEPLTAPDLTRGDLCASYAADGEPCVEQHGFDFAWIWPRLSVPSIHMPRAFSRLTLTVTGVKIEPLTSISAADAEAEGVFRHLAEHSIDKVYRDERSATAIKYFRKLWESLHGTGSWAANPSVAAISFTAAHRNIDAA